MNDDTSPRATPVTAELPESVTRPLEAAGLRAYLTIERADGTLATPHDVRICKAVIATAGVEDDGPRAREAFMRDAKGDLQWTPEARQALGKPEPSSAKRPRPKTSKKPATKPRKAAKRRTPLRG